jgi:hypothetical protein
MWSFNKTVSLIIKNYFLKMSFILFTNDYAHLLPLIKRVNIIFLILDIYQYYKVMKNLIKDFKLIGKT